MISPYRLLRAKAARTKLRVPRVWSWHIGLKPEDIFQASYPRSGSTWLRFILCQILQEGEESGFGKIDKCIPEIHQHRGVPAILPGGGRLIKTHEQYRKEYTRSVLLVRDVRDVILSSHARSVELGLAPLVSKGDLDSFMLAMLKGSALQMGSWQEHTRTWLDSPLAKSGNLLVVRYEDLRQKPEQELGQLLEFLEVKADLRSIRKAVEDNSLQQMRAKEDKARKAGQQTALLEAKKSIGEEGRFVRKGSVGGWRAKLTDAQIKVVDQYAGEMLATLGYETGAVAQRRAEPAVAALSR
jgi:hypothetical protein